MPDPSPPYYPPPFGVDGPPAPPGPRPPGRPFSASPAALAPAEIGRRWRDAQHLIRENGVTYNVYGDPRGIARPWQLDPVPLLIPPAEAGYLEAGLLQRG